MKVTTTDQLGREIVMPKNPGRIVSLVPSQTELLLDLGVPVVGRTKFCIHPPEKVNDIPIVGGTKKFRFDVIRSLKPDLIIGNKEENYQEGIDELARDFPVWMSDIVTLDDALEMILKVGALTGKGKEADELAKHITKGLEQIRATKVGRVVYLIWKNPWMAAGPETFIDSILKHVGYENVVDEVRYPEMTIKELLELKPEYVFLSSEPFPFKESHLEELRATFPNCKVVLVDGEMFSWYGSRLLRAIDYFTTFDPR